MSEKKLSVVAATPKPVKLVDASIPETSKRVKPILQQMSEVTPEQVSWLWQPYLPAGKLTLLEGDPGIGKTWLCLHLASIVSRGLPWPDHAGPGGWRKPESVIYLTAEDGLADTLRPRLDQAGADSSKVFALAGWEATDPRASRKRGDITLAMTDLLDDALREIKPALMIIDPIQAFLGKIDMHRANDVRPLLRGLAELAEKHKTAIVIIRHLGKSQQDRAIYRGLGSIDFSAAARSIILAADDPTNKNRRVIAHVKSSLAQAGQSLAYEITDQGLAWRGTTTMTPDALLAPPLGQEDRSAIDDAVDFLQNMLADGPRAAAEVLVEAKKAGISESSIRRAKGSGKLRVVNNRVSTDGDGGGAWMWKLA